MSGRSCFITSGAFGHGLGYSEHYRGQRMEGQRTEPLVSHIGCFGSCLGKALFCAIFCNQLIEISPLAFLATIASSCKSIPVNVALNRLREDAKKV